MIYDSCECYSGEDCCCRGDECCSDSYYQNKQYLARTFALTGLLRKVSDRTPEDLVYTYLWDTDLSGLSYFMFRGAGTHDRECGRFESDYIPGNYRAKTGIHITKAVARMAREYMIRCFWDHVSNITSELSIDQDKPNTFSTNRLYPLYVRQALDTLVVPGHSSVELKDIKHSIDAFYSSMCPMATDKTGWRERDISKEGIDVLSLSNIRKLDTLFSILYRYISVCSDTGVLPDPLCRETLFNLLDCLIMICASRYKFSETRRYKQLYEFSKLGSAFTGLKTNPLRYDSTYILQDGYKGEVTAALQLYSHMSPEAAICVGNNVAMYELGYNRETHAYGLKLTTFGDGYFKYPFTNLLKKLNPVPIPEVALYMVKEVELEKLKIKKLIANKRIPANGGGYNRGCCCCEEPECVAP